MVKVKPVQLGKTERMSFSRIDEVIDMPNFGVGFLTLSIRLFYTGCTVF